MMCMLLLMETKWRERRFRISLLILRYLSFTLMGLNNQFSWRNPKVRSSHLKYTSTLGRKVLCKPRKTSNQISLSATSSVDLELWLLMRWEFHLLYLLRNLKESLMDGSDHCSTTSLSTAVDAFASMSHASHKF